MFKDSFACIQKFVESNDEIRVIWNVGHVACLGYWMLGMWHVGDLECLDVRDVGCVMFGLWDVQDVGCLGCGVFRIWNVGDVGCWGCVMFGIWDVWDVGCLTGCGMLIYKMPEGFSHTFNLLVVSKGILHV